MRPRIEQELELLRRHWDHVEHREAAGEDWFLLPRYPLPSGWQLGAEAVEIIPVAFLVPVAYPGSAPYAFLAPAGLNYRGTAPGNTGGSAKNPPFEGTWMQFSWTAKDWKATSDVHKGSNLLAWSRSFGNRFREGA